MLYRNKIIALVVIDVVICLSLLYANYLAYQQNKGRADYVFLCVVNYALICGVMIFFIGLFDFIPKRPMRILSITIRFVFLFGRGAALIYVCNLIIENRLMHIPDIVELPWYLSLIVPSIIYICRATIHF